MSDQVDSRTEGALTERAFWKGMGIGAVGRGGDPVGFVNCCPYPFPSRSVPDEVLPGARVDLQLLQGNLFSVLVASYLTALSMRTNFDISIGESFG
ncbi:unnamed protein product [Schistocephalus solidus]|uniref:Uncharacterized protein n=1 Tax=Schistocephalus solidus TaxID=70667 RepID=A0A183TJ90_SCHSO|nr:unnamed protein product [Schistocephalus solidus]